jgi:hypothetical protein
LATSSAGEQGNAICRLAFGGFQLGDRVQHLRVLWETTGLVLAVNEPAVNLDVEDASGPLDKRRLDVEFVLDGGRQTGGFGVVVSLHAVGNGDVHSDLRARPTGLGDVPGS